MSRNARSMGISRFSHLENFRCNLKGKHVLQMQPPCELDSEGKQKWYKKQARYRRWTNNGVPKDYATMSSSAFEGPSTLYTTETVSQTLKDDKNLLQQQSSKLSEYTEAGIQESPPSLMSNIKQCGINEYIDAGIQESPPPLMPNIKQCGINRTNMCSPDNDKKGKSIVHNDYCSHKRNTSTDTSTEGVSTLYIDIGDSNYTCEYCNAMFWYGERLKGNCHRRYPKYTKCCGGGQVYLEKEAEPESLKCLFKNKHFLDNIRAYNQMFSMTSFGAEVDESINDGKGPYVFKISGEVHHWIGTLCPTNENELVRLFRTARDKISEGNVPEFKIQLFNGSRRSRISATFIRNSWSNSLSN